MNWTATNSDLGTDLYRVVYANGIFLATGDQGTLLTSTNSVDWVVRNSGTTRALYGATFGQDTFVVVGDGGTILQSATLDSGSIPPPGATLTAAPGWANGAFGLSLAAPLGGQWDIQASSDLLNWTPLRTITVSNTPIRFLDPGATNFHQRFYRAVGR